MPILQAPYTYAVSYDEEWRTIWRKTLANAIPLCYASNYIKVSNVNSDLYDGVDYIMRTDSPMFVKPTGKTMDCRQVFNEANVFFGKNPTLRDLGYTPVDGSNSGNAQKRCIYASYTVFGNNGTANDSESRDYNTNQLCFTVQEETIISDVVESSSIENSSNKITLTADAYTIYIDYQNGYVVDQPTFYLQNWASFVQNLTAALGKIPTDVAENVNLQEKPDESIDVSRKFEIVDMAEAKKQAFNYYTGDSIDNLSKYKFNDDDVWFMWNKAYEDMLAYKNDDGSVGVIAKAPKSFNGATEAKAYDPVRYPFVIYDESANVWWPLRVKDDSVQFSIVATGYASLALAEPSYILRIITNSSEVQSINQCITAAEKQYNDLRSLIAEERRKAEPDVAAMEGWMNAENEIREMLNNNGAGTYTNNGGLVVCTELPDGTGNYYAPDSGSQENPDSPSMEEGDPTGSSGSSNLAQCFDNASSLGWILCPATLLVGQAAGSMYDSIERDFLIFSPSMIDPDSQPEVYDVWKSIRDFANIIFAIALVIVILSQVTGIGVSNYGIKKILPSLIMVAVLVNLSFFLCQILIDVSNILGSGLKEAFSGFDIIDTSEVSLTKLGTGIMATLTTGAALFGGAVIAANTWELWVLPLFLAVLAALISILFFYILLAVRQALIIILIVISPIAIVCYALPNTRRMFDRWWKIFWALLVLYPICGALMGGTQLASSLFLSMDNNNFFFNLVAVLLQVVPIFFIPYLLKSSLNTISSLGMRISNFGKRLGGGLSHAVAGSDMYKDLQRQGSKSYATRRYKSVDSGKSFAGRLSRRLQAMGFDRAAGRADAYDARRRARMINAAKKIEMEDLVAGAVNPLTDAERNAIAGEAELAELDKMAKSVESDYYVSGRATDEKSMLEDFNSALSALRTNPDDRMARANMMGIHRVLSNSSGGRSGAIESMANAAADAYGHGSSDDPGIRFAASQMLRSAGGVYKSNIPGGFQFLTDAANGKIDFSHNFGKTEDGEHTTLRGYTMDKLGSFSGASLIGADDYTFESLLDVAKHVSNYKRSAAYQALTEDERAQVDKQMAAQQETLNKITAAALNNRNIDGKEKDQRMLNTIREAANLGKIESLYIRQTGKKRKK